MIDEKSSGSNGAKIAIISVLVTTAVVIIGFVLFNMVDFGNIERGSRNRGADDQYFFLNQMNNAPGTGSRVHVTEDSIYVVNPFPSEIIEFDHDFNQKSVIRIVDGWGYIISIHVTDDAIYYTALESIDAELYRYDRETSLNQHLASDVSHKVVVGNQIFHLGSYWDSYLYVFDTATGETNVLFDDEYVRGFFINALDNTIIFMDDYTLYRIDFDGDNLEKLVDDEFAVDGMSDFAFDGETLIWNARFANTVFMMDLNSNEEYIDVEEMYGFGAMVITEDYFVYSSRFDRDLSILCRSSNQSQHLVGAFRSFAVVGDYIIYMGGGETFDINVIDFDGNSRVLIEDVFD